MNEPYVPDLKQIFSVVKKRYPTASFCFFHGSMLSGSHTPGSDVDVIVVLSQRCRPFREEFRSRNFLFDAFIFDPESLNGTMHGLYRNCSSTLFRAVSEGLVLPAPTAVSEQLVTAARKLSSRQMLPNESIVVIRRHKLTAIYDDLRFCRAAPERVMLAMEAVRLIVEIRLLACGEGVHSTKHSARAYFERFSNDYSQLMASLNQAIVDDIEPLLSICEQALDLIGGPLREGFRQELADARLPLIG
jgi:predicted nucleotidyltransferase